MKFANCDEGLQAKIACWMGNKKVSIPLSHVIACHLFLSSPLIIWCHYCASESFKKFKASERSKPVLCWSDWLLAHQMRRISLTHYSEKIWFDLITEDIWTSQNELLHASHCPPTHTHTHTLVTEMHYTVTVVKMSEACTECLWAVFHSLRPPGHQKWRDT